MITGGLVVVIIGALIAFFVFILLSGEGAKLDESSKAYVDEVVPLIITEWSEEQFIENSSSYLTEETTPEDVSKLMLTLEDHLGKFIEYKESEGEAGIYFNNGGKTITAKYVVRAEFEKGEAIIDVELIQENDEWKILSFYIR